MTRKFLRSGIDLLAYGAGHGRSLAWYVSRRLQRV
jgi:hypothetical protein